MIGIGYIVELLLYWFVRILIIVLVIMFSIKTIYAVKQEFEVNIGENEKQDSSIVESTIGMILWIVGLVFLLWIIDNFILLNGGISYFQILGIDISIVVVNLLISLCKSLLYIMIVSIIVAAFLYVKKLVVTDKYKIFKF